MAEPRVLGEVILYRLYDVGYEIALESASQLLAAGAPERARPVRGEAQAIEIANPPVTVSLDVELLNGGTKVEFSARLFDFGVVSLRARVLSPAPLAWSEFAAFVEATTGAADWAERFSRTRERLLERMLPAIDRASLSKVAEDYSVIRIYRIETSSGGSFPMDTLSDEAIAGILIGENRPLSAGARRELLSPRFSYFEDDLTVLTWLAALVVEPAPEDRDVEYVLEFANAQLLELRYYDAVLDNELPRIYEEIAAARKGFHLLGRRYSRLLTALQTRVTDATELVERVENSLKLTDDVFLAHIYSAALEIFRERAWRSGIDRKIANIRDAYGMLNAESQNRRSEVLELVIVFLIVLEIVLTLVLR